MDALTAVSAVVEPLTPPLADLKLHDFSPQSLLMRDEVLEGLLAPQKTISCKYFYDERGSQLFDRICDLPEYYLTRTEREIMCRYGQEMADCVGRGRVVIEYGSGSSLKTRILLDHLKDVAAYIPIDISREHLLNSANALRREYPHLEVMPVCADYTQPLLLPVHDGQGRSLSKAPRVVYFPGSTLGNFTPAEAHEFLANIATVSGRGGGLLIGIDLKKEAGVLEPAYDDAQGVTAQFNLNVLQHFNRELGTDFDLSQFAHRAHFNEEQSRIEMHLVSLSDQSVWLAGLPIHFSQGEQILTEYSHKYSPEAFAALAASAGWQVQEVWTDPNAWFSVQYLTVS